MSSHKEQHYIAQALKMFLKQGVRRVTMQDIARSLAISTKTLYKHFADKSDLLRACVDLDNQIILETYTRIRLIAHPIEALLVFYQEFIHRLSTINPSYTADIRHYFPLLWQEATALGTNQLRLLLEKGVKEGFYFKNLDLNLASETMALLIRATLEDEVFAIQITDRPKLFAQVLYPYWRGICTEQGLDELQHYTSELLRV
jgi:AcrR family transcriptional regulator